MIQADEQRWSIAFARLRGGLHDLGQSTRSPEFLSWLQAKQLPPCTLDLSAETLERLATAIERKLATISKAAPTDRIPGNAQAHY